MSGGGAAGAGKEAGGVSLLDGGGPYYDTYQTADGGYVAVGALEPQFYAALLSGLGLSGADLPHQDDRAGWPVLRERFAEVFLTRTRDEWAAVFAGSAGCVAPGLSLAEAPAHPPNASPHTFATLCPRRPPPPPPTP